MKKDRREKLIKGHQRLFSRGVGIECGDGWLELIDTLCHYFEDKLINKEVKRITFAQIKEKFGLLRVYFNVHFPQAPDVRNNSLYEELHHTVNTIETLSSIVCEDCGQIKNENLDVKMRTLNGWKMTSCDECFAALKKRRIMDEK